MAYSLLEYFLNLKYKSFWFVALFWNPKINKHIYIYIFQFKKNKGVTFLMKKNPNKFLNHLNKLTEKYINMNCKKRRKKCPYI